jgi:glutamyl-Q tRNA(Asp) synthetase
MGSLLTALASYLHIKQQGGEWFVRIDDLDPPREDPAASAAILTSLQAHGLTGDRAIDYQSSHADRYQRALQQLEAQLFYCTCTRKAMASHRVYPGTCREFTSPRPDSAVRLHVSKHAHKDLTFDDGVKGGHKFDIAGDIGDFIVRRRDGLWAYNLATAVDDGFDTTHVLRGEDLFHVTPQQIFLMQELELAPPHYCHIPVLCFADGTKLSKQAHAPPLDNKLAPTNLRHALGYLGLAPADQPHWSVAQWLAWGMEHWSIEKIPSRLAPYQGQ